MNLRTRLDLITRINPRLGAPGYVEQIIETELLQDTGSGAGAIASGADDCRLRLWIQVQMGSTSRNVASGELIACGAWPLSCSPGRRTSIS